MLPYRDSRLTTILLGIFFLIAIAYALFEARGQLLGPTITVDTRVGQVDEPLLIVEGHAERISSLTMNGRQIPITEDGLFREPYLLATGYNKILLRAEDSYGRSAERVLEIVYHAEGQFVAPPPQPTASSTPTTNTPGSPSTAPTVVSTSSTTVVETSTTTVPTTPMGAPTTPVAPQQ